MANHECGPRRAPTASEARQLTTSPPRTSRPDGEHAPVVDRRAAVGRELHAEEAAARWRLVAEVIAHRELDLVDAAVAEPGALATKQEPARPEDHHVVAGIVREDHIRLVAVDRDDLALPVDLHRAAAGIDRRRAVGQVE